MWNKYYEVKTCDSFSEALNMTRLSGAWCSKLNGGRNGGEHASTMDRRYERKGNEAEKQGFLKKVYPFVRPDLAWGGGGRGKKIGAKNMRKH